MKYTTGIFDHNGGRYLAVISSHGWYRIYPVEDSPEGPRSGPEVMKGPTEDLDMPYNEVWDFTMGPEPGQLPAAELFARLRCALETDRDAESRWSDAEARRIILAREINRFEEEESRRLAEEGGEVADPQAEPGGQGGLEGE